MSTNRQSFDSLLNHLAQGSGVYYAVVDPTDEPRLLVHLRTLPAATVRCLYRGAAAAQYVSIAPHLIRLDADLLHWLSSEFWHTPWGIVLRSPVPIEAVQRHLRHFLTVLDPKGTPMYFRFYDPRVASTFLENCEERERRRFFGPVEAFFIAESEGFRRFDSPGGTAEGRQSFFLRIRPAMISAFAAAMEAQYARRLADHLASNFAEQVGAVPVQALVLQAEAWAAEARSYGITTEENIARYAELCACFPEMRQRSKPSWVTLELTYPNRPEEWKLDKIEDKLVWKDENV